MLVLQRGAHLWLDPPRQPAAQRAKRAAPASYHKDDDDDELSDEQPSSEEENSEDDRHRAALGLRTRPKKVCEHIALPPVIVR